MRHRREDKLAVLRAAETVCEYLGRGLACVAAVVDRVLFNRRRGIVKAGKYFTDLIGKYYINMHFTQTAVQLL